MRTAVILLTLLALAAIPGSLLPQRNVATDPNSVVQYIQDHPGLAPWLDRLWLFDVYASPWFAAIYLLLLVSMTGCVLPRCRKLWKSARSAPPPAPKHLARVGFYKTWATELDASTALDAAASELRRRRYRVVADTEQVRAEIGYLREVGNLIFHLSLLILLFGIAGGRLFGFEGRVVVVEGSTFTNSRSQYDVFNPSVWTDVKNLEPFSFTLEDFEVDYEMAGSKAGEPRNFAATVTYRTDSDTQPKRRVVEPNHPLNINGTKAFLTGNGYAPKVSVRDGTGKLVFTGPVVFLPLNSTYASDGVIKAPDAKPTQLGFEGLFLPTADIGPQGPYSMFPDALNPELVLTAYTGDLGLSSGAPQSVYTLDKSELEQVRRPDGQPFAQSLSVGESMTHPNNNGSLTFDGVARFANFQIARDPGKELSLLAALLLLVGLTASLTIRRRRTWVRIQCGPDGRNVIEVAGLSLTRREPPPHEMDRLLEALQFPADTDPTKEPTR